MSAPKTVLLHLNDRRRADRLLEAALPAARQWAAHVIGVTALPPAIVVGAGMPGAPSPLVLDRARKEAAVVVRDLQDAFDRALKHSGCLGEWRTLDAEDSSVAEVLLCEAKTVDLVIAMQADRQWQHSDLADVAETLVFEAGRPLLLLPNAGAMTIPAKRVLFAWDGGRESTRATFDGLAILGAIEAAKIISIASPVPDHDEGQAELVASLGRHGIVCSHEVTRTPWQSIGANLLSAAHDFQADLLVMGGYGHSRFAEMVLGGATRHVFDHAGLPVLMSH